MKRLPYFKFFAADVAFELRGFDPHERGAYISLLLWQWANGPLDDDDASLAKLAEVRPDVWRRIGRSLRRVFLPTADGKLALPWMEQQRLDLAKTREERAKAASQVRKPKRLKSNETTEANAQQLPDKSLAILEARIKNYPPTPPEPPELPRPVKPPPIPAGPVGDLLHALADLPAKPERPQRQSLSSKAKPHRPKRADPKPKGWRTEPPPPVPETVNGRNIRRLSVDLADAYERISGVGLCFEGMWPGFRAMTARLIEDGVDPDKHMLPAVKAAAGRRFQPDSLNYWRKAFTQRRDDDAARKARMAA